MLRHSTGLLGLALLAALTGCGGGDTAAPAVTVTRTIVPTTTTTTTIPPPVVVPRPPPGGRGESLVMPDLVGRTLQDAQDDLQRVVGSFFVSTSHDADGQGRLQLIDANWKVCTQDPAPGTAITRDSSVDFGTVKLAEYCALNER